ncbi:MAG: acetylxylan esterase [Solirubrobacteraceae bacterium]
MSIRDPRSRVRRRVCPVALAAAAVLAAGGALPAAAAAAGPPRGFLSVFDYDASAPLAPTARLESQTDLVRIQKVTYRGAGGERVPALLSLPKRTRGRVPCVIEGHGLTLSKEEGFGENAERYGARGVGVFAIDARYHGERTAGVGGEAAAARLETTYRLYRLTVIDLRRGLDYLTRRTRCDPARIGFEGYSMGGYMGSMLIGADRRVAAGVFYVSGADWRTIFSKAYVYFGGRLAGARLARAVRVMSPLDPKWWIPRASGRPVFMAAGRRDDRTPFAAALALQRAARAPKQVVNYDGGHDIEEPFRTKVFRDSFAFLGRALRFSTR